MSPQGTQGLSVIPVMDFPAVKPRDDIAKLTIDALSKQGMSLQDHDIVVIAQKIVSKSEDRYVDLRGVRPSERALEYARRSEKDPRLVELILRESIEVLRCSRGVIIVRNAIGLVGANAGIDASNVEPQDNSERVLLLPKNPDKSAEQLRAHLMRLTGVDCGVVINDSMGRAWRKGTIGTAIGAAGVASIEDLRGLKDLSGRTLVSTDVATADQIASAASLIQGQAAEGIPVVVVRGFVTVLPALPAAALVRPVEEDLFR